MKFIRSRVEQNKIIMYFQNDEGKIKKKIYPYNRLMPLTHKRKYKKYPPNSVSTNDIYNKMYNCDFKYDIYFNDLDF
jgi:hypothetical protein|tara:strand:- start:713 stop:943 length:231 start_codon:yes stop_codon:yes gene_type:complete